MPYADPEDQREYLRDYMPDYNRRPERVADRKRRQREFAARVAALKGGVPCADCGGEFPHICMDWHHVGDDKTMAVSQLVKSGNWQRVIDEVAKCELVCANCHRVRHG